jgi:DNA-binding transcriptional LysR family regulator
MLIMQKLNLATVDLNLLVALEVLLQECHITNAARRLNMSQPSMSRTLARLRATFDDQLLSRTASGYIKTPRAEALEGQLAQTLEAARRTFAKATFDPGSADSVLRISTLDYGEAVVLPALTKLLQKSAPSIELDIQQREVYSASDIQSGGADIGIGVMPQGSTEGCVIQELITDRYVCVMCMDHPLANEELTVDSFLSYGHSIIVTSNRQNIPIDSSLSDLGLQRKIVRRSCHFLASLYSLRHTELLQTSVRRLADLLVSEQKLVIKELPFEVRPIQLYLMWHVRNHDDQAHRWIREQIFKAVEQVTLPA